MSDFPKQIDVLAAQVLKQLNPEVPATAWEMKLKLKVPLSVLYMALGQLMKDELIRVSPEGLSYRIHLLPKKPEPVKVEEPVIVPNLTAAELPSDAPNAELAPSLAAQTPSRTVAKTVLGLAEVLEANGVLGDPELSPNQ